MPFLAGCPYHLVEQAEKIKPPANYKPAYGTAGISMDTALADIPFSEQGKTIAAQMLAQSGGTDDFWESDPLQQQAGSPDTIIDILSQNRQSGTEKTSNNPLPHTAGAAQSTIKPDTSLIGKPVNTGLRSQSAAATITNPISSGAIQASLRSIEDIAYPDSVRLRITVTDSRGHFITGLAGKNGINVYKKHPIWQILTDSCSGKRRRIASYTVREVKEEAAQPYALAFVLDHSPSMGDDRARKLQQAVRTTLDLLGDDDYVAITKFTAKIFNEVPLTNDYDAYTSQFIIDGLRQKGEGIFQGFSGGYGGGTAIYDGVIAGLQELQKAPAPYHKALILFTDGQDNSSKKASIDSVIRQARRQRVPVYSIAYGITDEEDLQKLSLSTGGQLYRIYTSKEFPYVLADIYKSLKNHYVVSYRPPPCADLHTVNLLLSVRADQAALINGTYDKSLFQPYDALGTIQFAPIEFARGEARIEPASMQIIAQLARTMQDKPQIKIEIRGHTDDIGSEEANQKLSEKRAIAVADALMSMGISNSRLRTAGFGETRPLVPNDSDENRRKNRRTEFVLIGK
jgi:VWFA-related protein